jgi:AcrR family transcriptional regulator
MGLRERKKEQTRRLLADTAWRLFAERGFDAVTVAEIAREADVAEATVFNYFPTKEDLFFVRLQAFGSGLVDAVAERPAGEPVLAAFRRALLAGGGLLAQLDDGDAEALERLRTVNRVIAESASLRAREQQVIDGYTDALAAVLAAESGTDTVRARVAANALMGVHRALIDHVRRAVLADEVPTGLASDVRRLTKRAFALLERGFDDFGAKVSRGAAASRSPDRGRAAPPV